MTSEKASVLKRCAGLANRCKALFQLSVTVLVLLIGLILPIGELFLNVPLLNLGRSLVASPAPSVFLYSKRLQFDLVVTTLEQSDQTVIIGGKEGFQRRMRGPLWRKTVYLNAFHFGKDDVLRYAFFGGGDLGKDLGIPGTVKQIVLRQWDADRTPIHKSSYVIPSEL